MADKSTHYDLEILKGDDIYNPNITFNNFEKIDNDMYNIDINTIHSATHILTGTVNALTLTNTEFNIFKFVATSPYETGQTFTVNGNQVSAQTTNGQPLDTNCYVIGATVLCTLNGTTLTLFVRNGDTVKNSLKLNGHSDDYFVPKNDLTILTIWDNKNFGNTFTPQIVNLNLNDYKLVQFWFCRERGNTDGIITSTQIVANHSFENISVNNAKLAIRSVNIVDNNIQFYDANVINSYGVYEIDNTQLIPYKIIGIRK